MKTAKLMLLALVAITLAMPGCARHYGMGSGYREAALERGVAEMNELLDRTVKDPERAKQAQAIFQDIVAEVTRSRKQTREYHQRLFVLNANYEATPEQFTGIVDEMNNARMASASKVLGLRFMMKRTLTAQEWKELMDAMAQARSRYAPKAEGM